MSIDIGVVIAAGVALGAAYALVGAAVSTVALATRTLHLAVGQVLVAGVLLRLLLGVVAALGWPPGVAVAAGLALGALLSAALQPLVLGRLPRGLPWLVGLVVAAAIVDAGTARLLGARTLRARTLLPVGGIELAGVHVDGPVVAAALVGLPAALLLAIAVRHTGWGRRIRLVGSSPDAAIRAGVDPASTRTAALAVGGVAAVLAGLLIAPITFVGPGQGPAFTIRGVAAAALLGRGDPAWAVPGGLLIGLAEAAAQAVWPQAGGDVAVAVLVVAVLVVRGSEQERAWGRVW